jgi:hypothetical protein
LRAFPGPTAPPQKPSFDRSFGADSTTSGRRSQIPNTTSPCGNYDRHPNASEKIGNGIEYFYIGRTIDGGRTGISADAIGFWINRLDQEPVDFSFLTAIRQPSFANDVKDALRTAARPLRDQYFDARFSTDAVDHTSDLTGKPLHQANSQVIYLDPVWNELVNGFVEAEGGWSELEVSHGDGLVLIGGSLRDRAQEARWLEYHRSNALLGLASISEAARRKRSR